MYVFGGCDPDLHKPSFIGVGTKDFESFWLLSGWMVKKPLAGKGTDAVIRLMNLLRDEQLLSGFADTILSVAVEEIEVVSSSVRGASPQSQIPLSISSGVMGMWLSKELACPIVFARPQTWKGSQPKKINQARTCKRLGIEYKIMGGKSPYCVPVSDVPDSLKHANDGDWKHLLDSAGLAIWMARHWKSGRK